MNRFIRRMLPVLLLSAVANAATPPRLTVPGKELFADDFGSSAISTSSWNIAKGDWKIKNGALCGTELESDHHAAVIRTDIPFSNAVIRFRFKLGSDTSISLSINQEKGHHSRIVINPEGFTVQKDRDKKDPRSLSLPLGRCNTSFKPDTWYPMTVEYTGDRLLASVSEQTFAIGIQDQIHTPKSSVGFTVHGPMACFDDFSICETTPSSDSEKQSEQLYLLQQKRADRASDPRIAYSEAETLLREQLIKNDPAFIALLNERIAIDEELHKRWPKAFRKGPAGTSEKKRLFAEDEEFKALTVKLAKARRAEIAYLTQQDPVLKQLRQAMLDDIQSQKARLE